MIIELFKQITLIPRCSGVHQPFINYIQKYALQYNYICEIDNANNILCYKKDTKPILCLQSHYDIVCLEDGKIPIIIENDGFLMAENSTLGADNGIGCAYMLALMSENKPCEFLFTCDEEIGLIGANNISLDVKSSKMLNLDSETMGEICIGCAGGIDIFATTQNHEIVQNLQNKTLYEISIDNLDGGHSGIDINKNIPNAIKLIFNTIYECDADIIDINGGQRINSIPKSAKAIIATNKLPKKYHKNMTIKKLDTKSEHYKVLDKNITEFIYNFQNGVLQYDKELDAVIDSINIAIITTNIDNVKIELSVRSMDNKNLKNIKQYTISRLNSLNFNTISDGKYQAWKPLQNEFSHMILKIHKKYFSSPKIYAIHAGLECAIFKEKFPKIQIVSIGPNIFNPHSNRETCDIKSAYKVYNILKDIINTL